MCIEKKETWLKKEGVWMIVVRGGSRNSQEEEKTFPKGICFEQPWRRRKGQKNQLTKGEKEWPSRKVHAISEKGETWENGITLQVTGVERTNRFWYGIMGNSIGQMWAHSSFVKNRQGKRLDRGRRSGSKSLRETVVKRVYEGE